MPRLTNYRYERFCQEYCADHNAEAAYERAGFAGGNGNAHKLFSRLEIQIRISELEQEGWERVAVNVELIREEMNAIAMADPSLLYVPGTNRIRPICDMPPEIVRVINTVKVDPVTGRVTEVKLESKKAALDSMARMFNLFEKDNAVKAAQIHIHMDEKDAKA